MFVRHSWNCGPLWKRIPNWASHQLWKGNLRDEGEMQGKSSTTNQSMIAILPPSGFFFPWMQPPLVLVSGSLKRDLASIHQPLQTDPTPMSTPLPPPSPSLPPTSGLLMKKELIFPQSLLMLLALSAMQMRRGCCGESLPCLIKNRY